MKRRRDRVLDIQPGQVIDGYVVASVAHNFTPGTFAVTITLVAR